MSKYLIVDVGGEDNSGLLRLITELKKENEVIVIKQDKPCSMSLIHSMMHLALREDLKKINEYVVRKGQICKRCRRKLPPGNSRCGCLRRK